MKKNIRERLYDIVFESDTLQGKLFDIILLLIIIVSIALVMLESIDSINADFGIYIKSLEWLITIVFTIEYFVRIYIIKKPIKYIFSFYGIIDFLALLPTYLTLFITGTSGFIVIRGLRLLRVFRILKLSRYTNASTIIYNALIESRHKLGVFLFAILTIATFVGTVMYIVEGSENGFDSIPESIYWAIVTITTVGYGDISPHTDLGKFISSFLMIIGYAIIAVPTGIVSASLVKDNKQISGQVCPDCLQEGHDPDAKNCKFCGAILNPL